jgi:hypothetical protein
MRTEVPQEVPRARSSRAAAYTPSPRHLLHALTVTLSLSMLALSVSPAIASKQVVDFFGNGSGFATLGGEFTFPKDVAVNQSGAGPADRGDIYVVDRGFFLPLENRPHRIQRLARNDSGTPAEPYDDTYQFLSAWGADVDSVPSGGADYEVCSAAARCKSAVPSAGNGTPAGNGTLSFPKGLAVDQDTGNVYVADGDNHRVNVYDGAGLFLRSFGFDVVESGPGDTGTGYEICVAADGDICKAGTAGAGAGQLHDPSLSFEGLGLAISPPDGNPVGGILFLADGGNHRVNTYHLDGTLPSSFGSAATFSDTHPQSVAIDSRGILYASNSKDYNQIERYDTLNANGGGVGFIAPIEAAGDEVQEVTISATNGQFRLSFGGATTADLAFNADYAQIDAALEALPSIGPAGVNVQGSSTAPPTFKHQVTFTGALGAQDVEQLSASHGTTPLSGGSGAGVTTVSPGHPGPLLPRPYSEGATPAMTVDVDGDGLGPETDVLYVLRSPSGSGQVQQFGPSNKPGLSAPPTATDDEHGTDPKLTGVPGGIAVDESDQRIYVGAGGIAGFPGHGVFILDSTGPPPTATLDSVSDLTSTSVTAHATIDPNGPPALSYHFEYSLDGSDWTSTPPLLLGIQEAPQAVTEVLGPSSAGLEPNRLYHLRLVAVRRFFAPVLTPELTFTTPSEAPIPETTGAPHRTTTSAQLNGRVNPRNSATTYHFEYGSQGPCDANPCRPTPSVAAGSGGAFRLVSATIEGLQPDTTYHYRLLADNGSPDGPGEGGDMTVTTRASEAPLEHGDLPGPPGSDRAYEQVSMAETSGNPVNTTLGFSGDGGRALYRVAGGTPIAEAGSPAGIYLAERTAAGWQTRSITPARRELVAESWDEVIATPDLSVLVAENFSVSLAASTLWRLRPGGAPERLLDLSDPQTSVALAASQDGARVLVSLAGGGVFDPAYPAASAKPNLYDLSSAAPELAGLLPGETVPACGAGFAPDSLSADGRYAYFTSKGDLCSAPALLYARDLQADRTTLISGPVLSGPLCDVRSPRSTPGSVFFWTQSRLDPADTSPAGCLDGFGGGNQNDGDIYRYDTDAGGLECVSCLPGAADADLAAAGAERLVAADGSRVYFASPSRLLPGSFPGDAYRIDATSGEAAHLGPLGVDLGEARASPDGSVLTFRSALGSLNPLGGATDNGGFSQLYRYDDTDRSLLCVSCPQDGSAPTPGGSTPWVLDHDGDPVFSTTTALLGADQNTPGPGLNPRRGLDLYEWRDGRVLLITDGLDSWPLNGGEPTVEGVSPSGNDIFFRAAARYTDDAPDAQIRLYDARIGGGFDFPGPSPPCSLEVCQGTPDGAPPRAPLGSMTFSGPGNLRGAARRRCPRGRVRRSGRCLPRPCRRGRARRGGRCPKPGRDHRRADHDPSTSR